MPRFMFTVHYSSDITHTTSAIYFLCLQPIQELTPDSRQCLQLNCCFFWIGIFPYCPPDTFLGREHYEPSPIFSKGIQWLHNFQVLTIPLDKPRPRAVWVASPVVEFATP